MVYTKSMGLFKKKKLIKPKTPGVPNINWRNLTKFCRMKEKSFSQFGKRYETPNGPYFYKDNGSDILAVAHLDYVGKPTHTASVKLADDTLFFCPVLDDRAGVYAILDYLPSAGLKFDILLTTNEENAQSTGGWFEPPDKTKKYKFIFSFDRAGTDVVLYQYKNSAVVRALNDCGWDVGKGTYSDICALEHLGCKAFNFGVGYYEQETSHSYLSRKDRSYLSRKDFMMNMHKFITFYKKWHNDHMPHVPTWNQYIADEGFGLVYKPGANIYQDTFTDVDIEIISILENEGYEFPQGKPITPDNINELIADYQLIIRNKKQASSIARAMSSQIDLNFDNVQEARSRQTGVPVAKLEAEVKISSDIKTAKKIWPIKLLKTKPILPSEDNPQYNLKQPSKAGDVKNRQELAKAKEELVEVTVVHAVSNALKEVKASAEELGMLAIGNEICSQCHKDFAFFSDAPSSLCPKCIKENESKEVPISEVKEEIYKGAKRLVCIKLQKKRDSDATYKYKEIDGKWRWTGEYPETKVEEAEPVFYRTAA